jgi:hypothetical protein
MKKFFKIIGYIFLAFIGMAILAGIFGDGKNTSKEEIQAEVEQPKLSLLEKTQKALLSVKDYQVSDHHEDVNSITIDLVVIGSVVTNYLEAKDSKDKEVLAVAKQLKDRITEIQVKGFPKLRKEFYRIFKQKAWEEDIDLQLVNNRTLAFSGSLFAANKNLKTFQESMSMQFNRLRFKQVRYSWYKGQDDYTYYDLTTVTDSEIIKIE